MSEGETLFIQELRKTLLRIFVPIAVAIILGAGSFAVAAPFRIKAVETKVDALDDAMVDEKYFIQITNELRNLNNATNQSLRDLKGEHVAEIAEINRRLDLLIQEAFQHSTRGIPQELR